MHCTNIQLPVLVFGNLFVCESVHINSLAFVLCFSWYATLTWEVQIIVFILEKIYFIYLSTSFADFLYKVHRIDGKHWSLVNFGLTLYPLWLTRMWKNIRKRTFENIMFLEYPLFHGWFLSCVWWYFIFHLYTYCTYMYVVTFREGSSHSSHFLLSSPLQAAW